MDVIINYQKSFVIPNLNPFQSVLALKTAIFERIQITPENQILSYHGKTLDDNLSLYQSDITHQSIIHLSHKLSGGFDMFLLLVWVMYFIAVMLYLVILISGLLPLIAHSYAYLLEWALGKVGTLLNLSGRRLYILFVWALTFIIRIAIVYYFVYAMTAFLTLPLAYRLKDNICASVKSANRFGFIIAIVFIIIYGLFNVPDEFLLILSKISGASLYTEVPLAPVLGALRQFADVGKFGLVYAIPFVGTPFLSGYHFAISIFSTMIKNFADASKNYTCDDERLLKSMGTAFLNWNKIPILKDTVQSYNLQSLMEVLPIGLLKEKREYYRCQVDNLAFWEKFWNKDAQKYYTGIYATQGFCTALKIIAAFDNILEYAGGSQQISNMIKTGNIGGMGAALAFIICLILLFIGWI